MKIVIRLAACATAAIVAGNASAADYTLRYTTTADPLGGPFVVDALLTTGTNPYFGDPNLYAVAASGTRNGAAIGLDGSQDSEFRATAPYLDDSLAQLYLTVGGTSYNVYYDGSFYHEFGGGIGRIIEARNFSITPAATQGVPEPATWAMMIVGFGIAGAAVRRRRTGVIACPIRPSAASRWPAARSTGRPGSGSAPPA